jgi:hypothetical protein
MPRDTDKLLYDNAVKWIHENTEDKSLPEELKQAFLNFDSLTSDNQAQLLKSLLEMSGLPEQIKASLSYLTQDLDALPLPDLPILEIKERLSDLDIKNLVRVSKRMHTLFQPPNKILNKLLERVAFGMQDKVEQLFTDVYAGNAAKIQEALRYRGRFTDYSGRAFRCTAYEYAYWAKDTHMCRMLERNMDDETKAFMLARIDANDANGLSYQQNGTEHRSAHFDFTPLKEAYQRYLASYNGLYYNREWAREPEFETEFDLACLVVGRAQRDIPAHVAQEYCRPDRSFAPLPEFNEASLPRMLNLFNSTTGRGEISWFPLLASNSGLGFDFAVKRCHGAQSDLTLERWECGFGKIWRPLPALMK